MRVITIFILSFVVVTLLFGALFFAIMTPNLDIFPENERSLSYARFENLSSNSIQFYPNMRFSEISISYSIEEGCGFKKARDIESALNILQTRTILGFYSSQNGQIRFVCSEIAPDPELVGHFVAGEGGPTKIINASKFFVIGEAKVSLYRVDKCDTPQIALHEILHALGFDHNDDKDSIMYPITECGQKLDDSIVNEINTIYSIASKQDLSIEKVMGNLSGRYLNFEIIAVNVGLKKSAPSQIQVISGGSLVKEFELGEMELGSRKILNVQNLRIPKSDGKVIFRVAGQGEEISLENNQIEMILE